LPAQAISKNMDLPQFAIWGDSDSVLPLKDVKDKISEIMPKLQLFVIKDSGHLPHKEQFELFNQIFFKIFCKNRRKKQRPSNEETGFHQHDR